jgi:hypothetical protein
MNRKIAGQPAPARGLCRAIRTLKEAIEDTERLNGYNLRLVLDWLIVLKKSSVATHEVR